MGPLAPSHGSSSPCPDIQTQSAAKLVPQAEQTGMYRQRIPAESLGGRLLGEIQNAQEVSFQVGPAELRLALVIFQVAAEAVTAQDPLKPRSQQLDQQLRSSRPGDGV